jgi:hypothetical protein
MARSASRSLLDRASEDDSVGPIRPATGRGVRGQVDFDVGLAVEHEPPDRRRALLGRQRSLAEVLGVGEAQRRVSGTPPAGTGLASG